MTIQCARPGCVSTRHVYPAQAGGKIKYCSKTCANWARSQSMKASQAWRIGARLRDLDPHR